MSNFTGFFLQTTDDFNKQFSPPDFFLSLSIAAIRFQMFYIGT